VGWEKREKRGLYRRKVSISVDRQTGGKEMCFSPGKGEEKVRSPVTRGPETKGGCLHQNERSNNGTGRGRIRRKEEPSLFFDG